MHRNMVKFLLGILIVGLLVSPGFCQTTGTIAGTVKDVDGKPISDGIVEWQNLDNGRKYQVKTNGKGEYFSLGIEPGKYLVTLFRDGKNVYHFSNVVVQVDKLTLDFDLQKERAETAKGQGVSPEQLKQMQEQQEKQQKEAGTVAALNQKLQAAAAANKAGDYDTAIATMTEATQLDPTRDVLWAVLGEAQLGSGLKQTDAAEKTKRLDAAIDSYKKAADLRKKAIEAGTAKAGANAQLAGIYNNMARAEANDGKLDQSIKDYDQAAQLDPTQAGSFYFNMGATLTNANKTNDPKMRQAAVDAFDKSIAADPNHADAYYYKGTNLIGGATVQGNKMVAPQGTAEAFNKYLEIQPTGPHAEEAKAMLGSIGAPIETSFGKKKASKK